MDTQLLSSTALVAPQVGRQAEATAPKPVSVAAGLAAAPVASGDIAEGEAEQASAVRANSGTAVLKQSAPNSALTTYRDQDSGRLIVRVYDRESGDVLVEFPPEKAFRPVNSPATVAVAAPRTRISV